jgi:hypothetical protein
VSQLLPDGLSLVDCPFPLFDAITTGLRILGYEEWPTDERPAKRIWMDGEKLTEHFAKVEKAREDKYGAKPEEDDPDTYEDNALELVRRG